MEHRWSNEVGSRFASVDICDLCHLMKVKPRVGPVLYVGKEGPTPEPPACKSGDEKRTVAMER